MMKEMAEDQKEEKVNDKKEESNCDDNKKKVNNHKGRYKIMIFSDGSLHVAQCIYNNDRCDVAFFESDRFAG